MNQNFDELPKGLAQSVVGRTKNLLPLPMNQKCPDTTTPGSSLTSSSSAAAS
jgi:hypothetical protein